MKFFSLFALFIAIFSIVFFFLNPFQVLQMDSTSMDSETSEKTGEMSVRQYDRVIVQKFFYHPLRRKDLVMIDLTSENNSLRTIRRISGIPGDNIDGVTIPAGHYYLSGDSTNAIDSRHLGFFDRSRIRGKVIYVIKNSL